MNECKALFILLVVMFGFSSFAIIESSDNCNFAHCTDYTGNGGGSGGQGGDGATSKERNVTARLGEGKSIDATIEPEGLQYNRDKFFSYAESYIANIGVNATNDKGSCISTKSNIVISCYFIYTFNDEKVGHPLTDEELKNVFGEPVRNGD